MPIYEYKPDFLSILKRRKRKIEDFFEKNIGLNISEENIKITVNALKKEYSLNKVFWNELSKYLKFKEKEIHENKLKEERKQESSKQQDITKEEVVSSYDKKAKRPKAKKAKSSKNEK